MKRILAALLILVLALGSIVFASAETPDQTYTIKVNAKATETVAVGQTVTVTVDLTAQKVGSFNCLVTRNYIVYDPDLLRVDSMECPNTRFTATEKTPGKIELSFWNGTPYSLSPGTFLIMHMTTLADGTAVLENNSPVFVYDLQGSKSTVGTVNATVVIGTGVKAEEPSEEPAEEPETPPAEEPETPPVEEPAETPEETAPVTWSDCAKDDNCLLAKYPDIKVTGWYHDGVHYCIEKGLMQGDTNKEGEPVAFRHSDGVKRAELVTMLWNLAGKPEIQYVEGTYTDVLAKNWYADSVMWATENKIVEGIGDGTFAPEKPVIRQEFTAMMQRFTAYMHYEPSEDEVETRTVPAENQWTPTILFDRFEDGATYSVWAYESIRWALGTGLIEGSDGPEGTKLLKPRESLTRAEAATVFMRYCETIAKPADEAE